MGYHLFITRHASQLDERDGGDISLEEWEDYVKNDHEMKMVDLVEPVTQDITKQTQQDVSVKSESVAIWTLYSKNTNEDNFARFKYSQGMISVKTPDDELIKKMISISLALNATVLGEDGEVYTQECYKNQKKP